MSTEQTSIAAPELDEAMTLVEALSANDPGNRRFRDWLRQVNPVVEVEAAPLDTASWENGPTLALASVQVVPLFLLIGAASIIAGIQFKAANNAREESKSQLLSANSLSLLQVDPELSLLLALRAAARPNPQSETALKRSGGQDTRLRTI